jgi:predicted HTH transcriptional regulator
MSKLKEIAIEAQKELQRIDGEIGKLTAERTKVVNVLKACEVNGKSLAATNVPHAHIAMFDVEKKAETHRDAAIVLLGRSKQISPKDLAEARNISNEYASGVLTKLVGEKIAKKAGRGVYEKGPKFGKS